MTENNFDLTKTDGSLSKINQNPGELADYFAQDIFLIKHHIAGTTHVQNIDDLTQSLNINSQLKLIHDTKNSHDKFAVAVTDQSGNKLGYLPYDKNEIICNLLDAGFNVFAKVETHELRGKWHYIIISIWLHA